MSIILATYPERCLKTKTKQTKSRRNEMGKLKVSESLAGTTRQQCSLDPTEMKAKSHQDRKKRLWM
jgi:nitrate reductase assembly molybdenum cofactor insertion protein NarJ